MGPVTLPSSLLLLLPSVTAMPVSLPLVRTVVLGEISSILVPTRRKSDGPVFRDDQPFRFDRSRSLSVHPDPNRGLLGHLLHLLLPRCRHCSPSLGYRELYVSSVLCVHSPKTNGALLRIILGRLHDGAFTSKVSVQIGWLSYLCIMWLATGAETAATIGGVVRCRATCVCFLPVSECWDLIVCYSLWSHPGDRRVWLLQLDNPYVL